MTDFPLQGVTEACATFIPGDNAKVFISGGFLDPDDILISDKFYMYNMNEGIYYTITPGKKLAGHSCVGARNSLGEGVSEAEF